MYHYSKYIARHLIHSTLLITFSLTSIVWLTQALRFIDFIVNQGVSVLVFVKLTVLLVPSLLLMILPPAFFCAVLFVYNKLKSDSELIVMQAAGLSRLKLAAPAIEVALLVMLVGYSISLYLQPVSYTRFKEMQSFLRNNYTSILLQEGVFSSPVDGLTVFLREREADGVLKGILVHDNRQSKAAVTMMAEEGKLVETPQGPQFILFKGNRQEVSGGKISFLDFDKYTMDISLYTKEMNSRMPDAQELFLGRLFTYDDTVPPAENQKRFAEGHQRLLWPAYSLCLGLIALAVLQSGQFNRRGQWQRVTLAVSIGVVVLIMSVALRGLVANQPALLVVAYLNLFLPMVAAWWVLRDREPFTAPTLREAV